MQKHQRQKTIEKDFDNLQGRARYWVLNSIAAMCKKEKLTFKHVYKYHLFKTGDDEFEIEDHKIWHIIHWYEELFGLIDLCLCVNGEWMEGQTPLIVFKKPY